MTNLEASKRDAVQAAVREALRRVIIEIKEATHG